MVGEPITGGDIANKQWKLPQHAIHASENSSLVPTHSLPSHTGSSRVKSIASTSRGLDAIMLVSWVLLVKQVA